MSLTARLLFNSLTYPKEIFDRTTHLIYFPHESRRHGHMLVNFDFFISIATYHLITKSAPPTTNQQKQQHPKYIF